ncbi:hypothetical protein REPUB_Repub03eG0142400 [Reevesia pubescens]
MAVWRLWCQRCKQVFNEEDQERMKDRLTGNIMHTAYELNASLYLKATMQTDMRLVGWSLLVSGYVRLNTNRASLGNPGVASAGCLLRTHLREWLVGFKAHLGMCFNIIVELQAVRYGCC